MRAAGLGAGAGQAMAAERLHADHGADHVAVDVDVADRQAVRSHPRPYRRCANGCRASARSRCARSPAALHRAGRPGSEPRAAPGRKLPRSVGPRPQLEDMRRDVVAGGSGARKKHPRLLFMRAICASSRCFSASITGPTWVAGSRGSPIRSSRAAPAIISIMRSATSSCTNSSRSAEQRWPAERKAEVTTSSATCSGSAVASTIIALIPPVPQSAARSAPSFAASVRLIDPRPRSSR